MNTGIKYEREMERIEEQDIEEETNEGIPRKALDPYVKVNRLRSTKRR